MKRALFIFIVFVVAAVLFTVFVGKCDHTPTSVVPDLEQPSDSLVPEPMPEPEPVPMDSVPALEDSVPGFETPPDSVPPFDPRRKRDKKHES